MNYAYQEGEGGIAEALGLAEDLLVVIVFASFLVTISSKVNICGAVDAFRWQKCGAKILLKEVSGAERLGVAQIRGDYVIGIEEKPRIPKSNYAVIGVYLYDCLRKIKCLKPGTFGPRRAGNHRSQQLLCSGRHFDIRNSRGMVDRRRNI